MRVVDKIQKLSPKILVIGDVMLDKFIFGDVDRISPEAPVPVVRCMEEKYSLGGCGNVLRNLVNLGVKASIISFIGQDQAGDRICDDLKIKGVPTSDILRSKSIRTTEKMRIVAEGQQLVRVDWDSENFTVEDYNKILNQVSLKIKEVDAVIVSDYDKGICTELIINDVINKVNRLQIPIFIDPKGKNWGKYYGATVITPNLKEAEEFLGRILKSDKAIESGGLEICNDLNLKACLITKGPKGMSYISKKIKLHVSSEAKEIYDVSGAGDTVIASFAAAKVVGFDPETVTRFSNKAAGIVVSHVGTTAITIPELED